MILHPVIFLIVLFDFLSLVFLCSACIPSLRALVEWDPGSASARQLSLEKSVEQGTLYYFIGGAAFAIGTALLTAAVSLVLPNVVPGAMCGTGVMEAMHGTGGTAFLVRSTALCLLYAGYRIHTLNLSHPDYPLVRLSSGFTLLTASVLLPSLYSTGESLLTLNVEAPVSCCAAVYDSFRSLGGGGTATGIGTRAWLCVFGVLTAILSGLSIRTFSTRSVPGKAFTAVTGMIALLWTVSGSVVLNRFFSSYHFEVLDHHCLWCLFLPQHNLIGYPLYGALLTVCFNGVSLFALAGAVRGNPDVVAEGSSQIRRGSRLILYGLIAFVLMNVIPVLTWRIKFGVWIGG